MRTKEIACAFVLACMTGCALFEGDVARKSAGTLEELLSTYDSWSKAHFTPLDQVSEKLFLSKRIVPTDLAGKQEVLLMYLLRSGQSDLVLKVTLYIEEGTDGKPLRFGRSPSSLLISVSSRTLKTTSLGKLQASYRGILCNEEKTKAILMRLVRGDSLADMEIQAQQGDVVLGARPKDTILQELD